MGGTRVLCVLSAALTLFWGCAIPAVRRTTATPENVRSLPRDAPFVKAHLKDGSVLVLSRWTIVPEDSALEGSGTRLDPNRIVVASGPLRAPRDSIVLLEANTVKNSSAVGMYTALLVLTAVGTIACIANPKACFGSCPTFYAEGEPNGAVQAEAFSASVAPSLEAVDVDALYCVRPARRDFALRVTNEALETHVIRRADILALPRGGAPRVAKDAEGGYWRISQETPPRSARAEEGDRAAELAAFDGVERFSLADSIDLSRRESIDLEFPEDPAGARGVLLSARQTLLTTFLFYQTLAYLGEDAGSWLARLERAKPADRARMGGLVAAMGTIEVWVKDRSGEWTLAGRAGEVGPIASDVSLVRLPADTPRPAAVQLRMARGMWRLDSAALVRVEEPVAPIRIAPTRVLREGVADAGALASLLDSTRTLVTMPGDEYVLEYRLPDLPADYEYFLEARGYYLEWMREEWAGEKSPERLAECLLAPAAALRRLAPEYKKIEPGMEAAFWRSRYVRR